MLHNARSDLPFHLSFSTCIELISLSLFYDKTSHRFYLYPTPIAKVSKFAMVSKLLDFLHSKDPLQHCMIFPFNVLLTKTVSLYRDNRYTSIIIDHSMDGCEILVYRP